MRKKMTVTIVVVLCVGLFFVLRWIQEPLQEGDGSRLDQGDGGQSALGQPPVPSPDEKGAEISEEEKSAQAIEAALAAKGMGNLKVMRLPSTDPDYYKGKLYETDSIVPDADYLKGSPRPVVFREYVHKYLREPLGPEDLAFFEQKLSEAEDEVVRLQCAVLLYRYGHVAGETYLASRLGEPDSILAATVLALNREEKYLSQILEVLSDRSEDPSMTDFQKMAAKQPLVSATSDWDAPGIGDAVFELSKSAHIVDMYYALSLARHEVMEAEIPIRMVMEQYADNLAVSQYFAALYRLTGELSYVDDIGNQLSFALEALRMSDSTSESEAQRVARCGYALEALSVIQLPQGTAMLRDSIPELRTLPENPELDDLLRKALLLLVESEPAVTQETVAVLVSELEKMPDDQNIRLGLAMEIGVDAVQGNSALAAAIGQSNIELARSLSALKEVPPYYLPDSSVPILSERGNQF